MIQQIMFVLAVPNLQVSASYYRDVLGFKIREIGDPGWRLYVRDNCRIMAGECADAIPPADLGDHSYYGYLVVDDAQSYFEEVKTNGAEILKYLRDEPWGMREFSLRTADGHRIMIGQDLE
jgi:catechol 2,3-dioxygenase-like lactoylglutathione lyase family enzyme